MHFDIFDKNKFTIYILMVTYSDVDLPTCSDKMFKTGQNIMFHHKQLRASYEKTATVVAKKHLTFV